MPTKDEVWRQLRAIPWAEVFFTRREVNLLPKILGPDEEVFGLGTGLMTAPGTSKLTTWLLVLTQHRILLIDKKLLVGFEQHEIPLAKVSSISCKTGLFFGEMTIRTSGTQIEVKQLVKKATRPFADAINRGIQGLLVPTVQSPSPTGAPTPAVVPTSGHGSAPAAVHRAGPAQFGAASSPPVSSPAQYYVVFGGEKSGPYDIDAMTRAIEFGQLTGTTKVWWPGAPQWTEAQLVPELAVFLGPPAIPK